MKKMLTVEMQIAERARNHPECLREFLDRRIKDGVISISQLSASETVNGGTVCRKAARTGLWGSGEVNEPLYPDNVYIGLPRKDSTGIKKA
jgi:hypothetical protein